MRPKAFTTEVTSLPKVAVFRGATWRLVRVFDGAAVADGPAVTLGPEPLVLGREPEGGLALDDPRVSRRHAEVRRLGPERFELVDLESRNGSFLDGRPITRAELGPGSVLRIGDQLLVVVRIPGGAEPPFEPGRAAARAEVESAADRLAKSPGPLLLAGPTGSGKEVLARRIHAESQRRGPFIAVRAASLGEEHAATLFGRAGANGVVRPGLFARARGGTLFFDEVGELPTGAQSALLRVLEDGSFRPQGSPDECPLEARILAGTQADLLETAGAGRFRADLLERLSVQQLSLPPLAARREELLHLFARCLGDRQLHVGAAERLLLYAWPRNVRQLESVAERVKASAPADEPIRAAALPKELQAPEPAREREGTELPLRRVAAEAERWPPPLHHPLAKLLAAAGEDARAAALLEGLGAPGSSDPDLLASWARVQHARGRLTEAMEAFGRAPAAGAAKRPALLEPGSAHLALAHSELPEAQHAAALLEQALASFARGEPGAALPVCDRLLELAATPEITLQAGLHRVWFQIQLGELGPALATVEALGRVPALEQELNRLHLSAQLLSARREGDDEARARALLEQLHARTQDPEYLARLAALARRAGDLAEATRLERRFERAFREAEERPSARELLELGAAIHLPVAVLAKVDRAPSALEEELERRHRELEAAPPRARERRRQLERTLALGALLSGDAPEAAARLELLTGEADATAADHLRLAEARLELRDRTGALESLQQALALDPELDADAWIQLLELLEGEPTPPRMERALRQRAAEAALLGRARIDPLDSRIWRALERMEQLAGVPEAEQRFRGKWRALEESSPRGPQIGQVNMVAVYALGAHRTAMIHELWATRQRAEPREAKARTTSILGRVAEDMKQDVRGAFLAARAFAKTHFPHLTRDLDEHRYALKITKDDEVSGGNSAGVAVALAFLSLFLQKPLPRDIALSGAISTDSSSEVMLWPVAEIEEKMIGVYRRNLRMLILPEGNRADLETSFRVPRSVWEPRVRFARNLSEVVRWVYGDVAWMW